MDNKTRREQLNEILLSLSPQEVLVFQASLRDRLSTSENNQEILIDTIQKVLNGDIKVRDELVMGNVSVFPGEESKLIKLLEAQLLDSKNEQKHILSIINKFRPLNELFEQMSVEDTDMNNTFNQTGFIYDSLSF